MVKRMLACLTALCLILAALPCALAEETDDEAGELTQEEIDEVAALDDVDEDELFLYLTGPVYQEKELTDFDLSSPALYTCRVLDNSSLFTERSLDSRRIARCKARAEVLYVGSNWVIVRSGSDIGFIKRARIHAVKAMDTASTPPYGVQKSSYIATTANVCEVRRSMSNQDGSWITLNPGTMLSIWKIQDGWAIVPYHRTYGYISLSDLTDLIPVSPTDQPIREDSPIAAYTSYYKMDQTTINLNRITNIAVACQRLTRVMAPGESLNFNKDVGPYKKSLGYKEAPVLVNGTTRPGFGGGTCQVSSTLYNALLQLPGVEILQRRPHGPGGASYLPHGVDAAVGSTDLNLRFRNNYDFPIRVEGHTSDDGALLMLVYRADE